MSNINVRAELFGYLEIVDEETWMNEINKINLKLQILSKVADIDKHFVTPQPDLVNGLDVLYEQINLSRELDNLTSITFGLRVLDIFQKIQGVDGGTIHNHPITMPAHSHEVTFGYGNNQ